MLQPLHDYLVLEEFSPERKTKSGIILTTEDKNTPTIGIVKAVGEGTYVNGSLHPPKVSVGDKVICKSYATTSVKWEETDYIVVKEADVIAIVKEEDDE